MKNNRDFLRCSICGNVVGMIEDAGIKLVCCGKEMTLLKPNTVDASQEKHVPVARLEGNMLTVTVGSIPHPMTVEHHIAWIAIAQGGLTQRMALEITGLPTATFCVGAGEITVYDYCNLHGLWASEIDNPITDEIDDSITDDMVCSAEFSEGCKEVMIDQ